MSNNGTSSGSMSNNGTSSGMSNGSSSSHMSHAKVKKLQRALNNHGNHLKVDGIMGSNTRSALKKYQRKNGMQATGQPNSQTMQSLGVGSGGSMGSGNNMNHGSNGSGQNAGMSQSNGMSGGSQGSQPSNNSM
jgi:peptidoglycan hydrolase-like protein with peptidoglycan-binding domain